MEVFILIRTENTDAAYSLIIPFKSLDEAKVELERLFYIEINEREHEELVTMSKNEDITSAYVEDVNGIVIHWSIKSIMI